MLADYDRILVPEADVSLLAPITRAREKDFHIQTGEREGIRQEVSSSNQLVRDCRYMSALKARCGQFILTQLPFSFAPGYRGSAVRGSAGYFINPHLSLETEMDPGIWTGS